MTPFGCKGAAHVIRAVDSAVCMEILDGGPGTKKKRPTLYNVHLLLYTHCLHKFVLLFHQSMVQCHNLKMQQAQQSNWYMAQDLMVIRKKSKNYNSVYVNLSSFQGQILSQKISLYTYIANHAVISTESDLQ